MRSFQSEDRFEIKGRGTVFTMKAAEAIPTKEVYGCEIEVDGVKYYCLGIERFGINLGKPEIRKGERVGLLVRKI